MKVLDNVIIKISLASDEGFAALASGKRVHYSDGSEVFLLEIIGG
jgi:hypothetical protein